MHVWLRPPSGAVSSNSQHTALLPAGKPPTNNAKRATGVYSSKAARNGSVTSDILRQATVCSCVYYRRPAASEAAFQV
jgi:hypothetical protein